MYERFTARARKVMELAEQKARAWQHGMIGTECLLWALAEEGGGKGMNALKNARVESRHIFRDLTRIVHAGPEPITAIELPQTPRTKKILTYATEEAFSLSVDTGHLLIGMFREQEGVAAQVLMNLGGKLEVIRHELLLLPLETS